MTIKALLVGETQTHVRQVERAQEGSREYVLLSPTKREVYDFEAMDVHGNAVFRLVGLDEREFPRVSGSSS